ncbi:hypothetical protein EV424DRAFT_1282883, partial [Suillus variegatus]
DDIKVEYHPHSKLPSIVHHFAAFSRSCSSEGQVPCNDAPWKPFQMQLDFEVTEIALEAAMAKEQMNRLLDLVFTHCGKWLRNGIYTLVIVFLFVHLSNLINMWFQKDVVSVEYDNKTHEFEMYYCPLWDWALDLLRDSCLTPHF